MDAPPLKNNSVAVPPPTAQGELIKQAVTADVATRPPDDALVVVERAALEAEKLRIENERLKNQLNEAQDLHTIRKIYTGRLFGLIVAWLSIVVVFVALTATLKPYFMLADSVLIAFITSTTVSVLGLFVLVAKWLFPNAGRDEAERQSDNRK